MFSWFKQPKPEQVPTEQVLIHVVDEIEVLPVEKIGRFNFVRLYGNLVRLNPDGTTTGKNYVRGWEAL